MAGRNTNCGADLLEAPSSLLSIVPASERARDEIEKLGLFSTLEKGIFADVKRPRDGGKGLAGVVMKGSEYFNPFIELMKGGVAE